MKPYALTEAQLAALPTLTGAELLAQFERRVWRRWNLDMEIIESPADYIDPERIYRLAPKDKLGRRMAYPLSERPPWPAAPDFFIIGRMANAKLKLLLAFP